MKKRVVIGIILALLIVVAGIVTINARPKAPPKVAAPIYSVHRSNEEPLSTHRTLSTAAADQATIQMPWAIALDPMHGFTWVAEPGCEPKPKCLTPMQGSLGQYALSDGSLLTSYAEPKGYSSPMFLAVDGQGNIWFTEPETDALGEFMPQSQSWNQWPLKKGSAPFGLVFDKQGNLWFTEYGTNAIGYFNPRTHTLVETQTPTTTSQPYGITIDPQGSIWFAENSVGISQIGSFTPTQSGTITIIEHVVNTLRPHEITADRAGNIWYTGGFQGTIGEFDPKTGRSKSFPVYYITCLTALPCAGTHISGISVDKKGNIWFTDSLSQRVGYLIPATGQVVTKTLSSVISTHPYDGLVIDSSNRVWFTEQFLSKLLLWPSGTL